MSSYSAVMDCPLPGVKLGIIADDGLSAIDFLPTNNAATHAGTNALARETVSQLARYFAGSTNEFDLPLSMSGTAFRCRVWKALRDIPYGSVLTYGSLAKRLSSAARAVGQACGANPVPIVVPCHRVVAASGMGGFMGCTSGGPIDIKQWLLQHEGVRII